MNGVAKGVLKRAWYRFRLGMKAVGVEGVIIAPDGYSGPAG
jgi:hypothetical protein